VNGSLTIKCSSKTSGFGVGNARSIVNENLTAISSECGSGIRILQPCIKLSLQGISIVGLGFFLTQ
jgi:hypothetical protein